MHPGARPRFVLVYQDRRIPLPDGELVVGRGLGCHIRLNAEAVSRQHVKLVVRAGRMTADNLSTTTGTLLNGARLEGARSLGHGDTLTLGPRSLRIEVEDVDAPPSEVSVRDDDITGEEEVTRTDLAERVTGGGYVPASIEFHNCPKCREKIAFASGQCSKCGYAWSSQHPSAVTSRVTMRDMGKEPPTPQSVPVVYASEELTIDAVVTLMRADGAFVPSELLDPVGTTCELTLLPDGIFAMSVGGTVKSVKAIADATGPAGMHVTFADVPPTARAWLDRWLAATAARS
jgi:pSer/pThr/pTyr-binding forkhead associated (FHA) protein